MEKFDKQFNEKVPPTLLISTPVEEVQIKGYYDENSDTWSDRDFAGTPPKKHRVNTPFKTN